MLRFQNIFTDCTKYAIKLKSSEYKESGGNIIIDQSQNEIAGYTDNESGLYKDIPALIFGDHTRCIKYIDKPFYIGADGVKVLKIKLENANYKYWYYALKNINIPNTGYNRHFKWLKESYFKCHTVIEQQNIVDKLDAITNIINQRQLQLQLFDNLIKSRFVEMFGDGIKEDETYPLQQIKAVGKVVSGATPKTNNSDYWNGNNIWITPAEINDDSFFVTDSQRKITESGVKSCTLNLLPSDTIILSSRAPIGKVAIAGVPMYCNQGFKNIIPNDNINSIYLYHLLKMKTVYLNSLGRGATFKELSKEIVENINIKVPPIELQNQFADFVEQVNKSKFIADLIRNLMEIIDCNCFPN